MGSVQEINNRICQIIQEHINPQDYADWWLTTPAGQIVLPPYLPPPQDHMEKFFSRLPDKIYGWLSDRDQPDLLFLRLFQAVATHELPILAEAAQIEPATPEFSLKQYVANPEKRLRELKKDISAIEHVLNIIFDEHAKEYLQFLLNQRKAVYDNGTIEITRTQYATLCTLLSKNHSTGGIVLSGLYVLKLRQEQPTRVYLHALCCIVYGLLQIHAKNARQSGKAHCRGLTAQILTNLLPPTKKGAPLFNVTERAVEYALTGR